ncbi:hypothetical protein [Burkholderia ubonensis]|uniref:hypothetical protein n=1 Tax=Burkholderia ubonensis TaxID=101571 RepID=UPI0012F958A6|nr:hypothetical protein [Burkholderia ubonensis]
MACSSATLCAANPAAQISGIRRNAARQRIAGAPLDCAATIVDSRPARRRSIVRAFKKASAGRGQIQHAAREGANAIVSSDEFAWRAAVDAPSMKCFACRYMTGGNPFLCFNRKNKTKRFLAGKTACPNLTNSCHFHW